MPFSILKIFGGQFQVAGNSTHGPSEEEKLISSSKKRIYRLPLEERFLDPIQKKRYFNI